MGFGDVMKECAREWKEATEEVRNKYNQMANETKVYKYYKYIYILHYYTHYTLHNINIHIFLITSNILNHCIYMYINVYICVYLY